MAEGSILSFMFYSDDLGKDVTVKDWLKEILLTLLEEREGFSGKRPLGNSNWTGDLEKALVEHKIIKGTLDEEGYLEDADFEVVDALLEEAVRSL